MTGQQAIRLIDRLLDRVQQRKLNDLESTIVLQTWEGNTYRSISDRLSYDLDYIKQIAARLWKSLSGLLGENIGKSNIKSVLERFQESIPLEKVSPWSMVDWIESIDVSDWNVTEKDLYNLETWMISDRTTIAFFSSSETTKTPGSIQLDSPQQRFRQRQIQDDIQSAFCQNPNKSAISNILIDKISSVLMHENSTESHTICLIINCHRESLSQKLSGKFHLG